MLLGSACGILCILSENSAGIVSIIRQHDNSFVSEEAYSMGIVSIIRQYPYNLWRSEPIITIGNNQSQAIVRTILDIIIITVGIGIVNIVHIYYQ